MIFNGTQFTPSQLSCGVPQGSVLGPLEFIAYTEDVHEVFERHSIRYHLYADDKQVYMSVRISEVDAARQRLTQCIKDIRDWCASRRLRLNASKTELVWFGMRASLQKMSLLDLILSVDADIVTPTTFVRDLGVYLDNQLTMKKHISLLTRTCYFHLRRLRQIRRTVGREVTQ